MYECYLRWYLSRGLYLIYQGIHIRGGNSTTLQLPSDRHRQPRAGHCSHEHGHVLARIQPDTSNCVSTVAGICASSRCDGHASAREGRNGRRAKCGDRLRTDDRCLQAPWSRTFSHSAPTSLASREPKLRSIHFAYTVEYRSQVITRARS